jgi:hypothetical protein
MAVQQKGNRQKPANHRAVAAPRRMRTQSSGAELRAGDRNRLAHDRAP